MRTLPLLFNIALDWVMKNSSDGQFGITWGLYKMLEEIDYADDICLLAHRHQELQDGVSRLTEKAKLVGLKVNVNKIKLIRIGTTREHQIHIDDEPVKVGQLCCLGCIIGRDCGTGKDVVNRIKKARQTFGILNNILTFFNVI